MELAYCSGLSIVGEFVDTVAKELTEPIEGEVAKGDVDAGRLSHIVVDLCRI